MTTETPIQRPTPAGQAQGEGGWLLPDMRKRDQMLNEARVQYQANVNREGQRAWEKTRDAARIIMLLTLIDEQQAEADRRTQQIADALRERDALVARCAALQSRLDAQKAR